MNLNRKNYDFYLENTLLFFLKNKNKNIGLFILPITFFFSSNFMVIKFEVLKACNVSSNKYTIFYLEKEQISQGWKYATTPPTYTFIRNLFSYKYFELASIYTYFFSLETNSFKMFCQSQVESFISFGQSSPSIGNSSLTPVKACDSTA